MTIVSTYVRCSTSMQDTESQEAAIAEFVAQKWGNPSVSGITLNRYADEAKSGADHDRVDLQRLLISVGMPPIPKRKFGDTAEKFIVVSELSRLSRDTDALMWILATSKLLGIRIIASSDPGMTGAEAEDITGNVVQWIINVIRSGQAELERDSTRKRVKAGVRNVRTNGDKETGNKEWGGERVPVGEKGGRRFTDDQEDDILTERFAGDGLSVAELAKKHKTSQPTIRKALRKAADREADRQEKERAEDMDEVSAD